MWHFCCHVIYYYYIYIFFYYYYYYLFILWSESVNVKTKKIHFSNPFIWKIYEYTLVKNFIDVNVIIDKTTQHMIFWIELTIPVSSRSFLKYFDDFIYRPFTGSTWLIHDHFKLECGQVQGHVKSWYFASNQMRESHFLPNLNQGNRLTGTWGNCDSKSQHFHAKCLR